MDRREKGENGGALTLTLALALNPNPNAAIVLDERKVALWVAQCKLSEG